MFKVGERGSVTLIALMVFLMVAIFVSGLFIVPSALSLTTQHIDLVQAEYAAESGVKRAIAACKSGITNWNSWVGTDCALVKDESPTYRVTIKKSNGEIPTWITNNLQPETGNYIIRSTGKTNGSITDIICEISITNNNVNFPEASLVVKGEITVAGGVNPFWVHNIAIDRTENKGKNIPKVICGTDEVSSKVLVGSTPDEINKYLIKNSPLTLPDIDIDSFKNEASFKYKENENNLSNSRYYYGNDLTFQGNVTLNGFPSVIFVKGDLIIQSNINVRNIMFIVEGDVTLNGPNINLDKSVIYTKGNMTVNGSGMNLNGGSNLIVGGNLKINQGITNFNGDSDIMDTFENIINGNGNQFGYMVSVNKWRKN